MNKKKIFIYGLLIMFFVSITLFSSTFAKYVSNVEIKNSVEIGELYVGYENGQLYRNEFQVTGQPFNQDGHTVIEVFDIKPADKIIYYFTISNISYIVDEFNNLTIKKYNTVNASYTINISAKLLLPSLNGGEEIEVTFDFGKLNNVESGEYVAAFTDTPIGLNRYNPNKDGSLNINSIYEQKYRILIDEEDTRQLQNLTSKEYFGASLCIYITVTSEQNVPIITD